MKHSRGPTRFYQPLYYISTGCCFMNKQNVVCSRIDAWAQFVSEKKTCRVLLQVV